jgi:YebC/PmpR family DNA-binding regulatory protein
MSGHNRWTKIKHKKEAMGATKGAAFSKISKELTVAARIGGADPNGNFRLRSAMDAARAVNMPSDTITRAIKKGTGELEGVSYEELKYEGYGPSGVALIVECLTDNKNRTAGEVRSIFTKGGGSLGEAGSVSFMFERKGTIEVKPGPSEDTVMEAALDAGAEDVINLGEEGFEVRTDYSGLFGVAEKLSKVKGVQLGESKARYLPLNTIALQGDPAQKVMRLIDALEECDDVQNVYANAEIDDATLDALA